MGVPPGLAVAVFAQSLHDKAHVLKVAHASFRMREDVRMPEPKAFRMAAHQASRALAQFRRSRRRWRQFAQLIGLGSHENNVSTISTLGKESLPPGHNARHYAIAFAAMSRRKCAPSN